VATSSWPKQWRAFALFFFAYYGYVGILSPYVSLFFAGKGIPAAQIGVLMSLSQAMRIFGPNLWGWIADRSQKRVHVLRLTALATVVAFVGMLYGRSFVEFFLIMLLVNGFSSALAPVAEAHMLTEMRGDLTHYGKLRLWGSVGFIIAVLAVGSLLDWQGVQVMPWAALSMLLLAFFASCGMQNTPEVLASQHTPSARSMLKRPEVMAFFVSAFLMIAAHSALYVFYSLYLAQLGYSKTLIGLMWSLGVVAEIVFFFYQAPVFRRFGVRNLMIACFMLAALRFCMIGFGAESLVLLLIAQILHAATFGVHHSASIVSLQRWFHGPLQARGQALFISVSYGLGGTIGGLVLSIVWDKFGPQMVYSLAALMATGGAVAAACCYRWQSTSEEIK
jgi:MFS transporter, PPP family, 3-phenylpropionic acid transporter